MRATLQPPSLSPLPTHLSLRNPDLCQTAAEYCTLSMVETNQSRHVLLCAQPHVSFHACRATPVSHKSLRQRGASRLWGLFRRAVPAYFACARSGDTTLCSMTGVTTGMILHGVVSPDPRLLTRMLALPQSGFLIVLAMKPGLRIHLKSLRSRREIVNWVQIAQTPRPPRPHASSASVKLTGRFRTGHLYLALRCCGCGPGESDAHFSCPAHISLRYTQAHLSPIQGCLTHKKPPTPLGPS